MLQAFPQMTAPGAGFADPVMAAQAVFRAVMMALAEPGTIRTLDAAHLAAIEAPAPLSKSAAAVLLALADFESPVWLDGPLATPGISSYLRFHAGCPIVAARADAQFAVIADGATLDTLDGFALGSLEYPDRSATLIVQVESLDRGIAWRLNGPGIDGEREIHLGPVHAGLAAALADNRALFPRGVDIVFTDGASFIGLPRSTNVMEA